MLEALLTECGLDYAHCFEPGLKEQPIPGLQRSYRELAQTLGTEWGRQLQGEDFWLRCAGLCTGLQHEDPALNEPIPSDFNHLHFGSGQSEAEISLPPGEHTIAVDKPGFVDGREKSA